MPGAAHETLVALLQLQPALFDEMLQTLGHRKLPGELTVADSTMRAARPLEVRPDLVLVDEKTGAWVLLEVQLDEDSSKERKWLSAAGMLLDARGIMGDVYVLTHDAAVARWAARVATAEGPGGSRLALTPVVVQLTKLQVDKLLHAKEPALAVFAAWAVHDQKGKKARQTVRTALDVLQRVEDTHLRSTLVRAILSMVGNSLFTFLRELFMKPIEIPESPLARALRLELEALGEARGEARGRLAGEAEALLMVLAARELTVDETTRHRITTNTDPALMKRWITRAATAKSIGEVFAETANRKA